MTQQKKDLINKYSTAGKSYQGVIGEPLEGIHIPYDNILGVENENNRGKRTIVVSVGIPGNEFIMPLPEQPGRNDRFNGGLIDSIIEKQKKTIGKAPNPVASIFPMPLKNEYSNYVVTTNLIPSVQSKLTQEKAVKRFLKD